MSKGSKRKIAQLNNLDFAREAKRRDLSMNAGQEAGVLSADATKQSGFVAPAQGELTEEDREVSICKCVLIPNKEVLQEANGLCECC